MHRARGENVRVIITEHFAVIAQTVKIRRVGFFCLCSNEQVDALLVGFCVLGSSEVPQIELNDVVWI